MGGASYSNTHTIGHENMLVLASSSERRRAFMRLLGVEFRTHSADVDETANKKEAPTDYVLRVALAKAKAVVSESKPNTKILAADTVVCLDGEIFGKPEGKAHAFEIYQRLSGRWHDVHTGVAFIGPQGNTETFVVTSQVEMVCMNQVVWEAYWDSGESQGKAGGYAIQGLGGALIRKISGSYSSVVGLPLVETVDLFNKVGIPHKFSGC